MQKYLVFDIETRSECDLKKCGAWEYSVYPTTNIFCVSWCIGTREDFMNAPIESQIKSWSPIFGGDKQELVEHLLDPDIIAVAHNAGFEQYITKHVLSRIFNDPRLKRLKPERFLCTASLASVLAVPRSLEGATKALKLSSEKDTEGRRLILKYTKPRKPTKNNTAKWHNKMSDLLRIIKYCENDVKAEVELFLKAYPLIDIERKIWVLDQQINQRGFRVDTDLVSSALALIGEENANIQRNTKEISDGAIESTTQRDATLKWVKEQGYDLPNLQAKTIADALPGIEGPAREILKLRQAASKTSTAKYQAFEFRSQSDGRCRDNLIYHGPSTGRWAGAGVQPQNFPRGNIKDVETLAKVIKTKDLELVRMIYGEPMSAFSSALRGCIIASPGKEIFVADFNAIEARVLFWMAEHEDGVRAFREGRDLYIEMASVIYRIPISEIPKDSLMRFLGKEAILGCGFGLGAKKFIETCAKKSLIITEEMANFAVKAYRSTHAPVPKMWSNIERAAIAAVTNKNKTFTVNKTSWFMKDEFLVCKLPSSRCLYYYGPEIRYKETPWGEKRPVLYHWGVDSLTKQWCLQKTWGGVLTENVVQATARDLMANGMINVDFFDYEILLTVHDEILAEKEKDYGSVDEFEKLMSNLPKWAEGCPVKAEGFVTERYKK